MHCRKCSPPPEEVRRAADLLERRYALSVLYVALQGILQLLSLLCQSADSKELEIVVLRHETTLIGRIVRKKVLEADPDGKGGLASWNATRPPFVEADAVQRAGLFARNVSSPLYIVHTSSEQAHDWSLRQVRRATQVPPSSIATQIQTQGRAPARPA